MVPPADQSARLLYLQGEVARLRLEHEELVERERVFRNFKYIAAADALRVKVDKTFGEFSKAQRNLATFISRRQRGLS